MSLSPVPDSHFPTNAANSSLTPDQITALQTRNAELEAQVQHLTQSVATLEARYETIETQFNDILSSAIATICRFRAYQQRPWEYEYRSAGCEVIFGYTSEEFLADPDLWRSRVLPSDFETVIVPTIAQIFAEQPTRIQYRFRHKDESLRWISERLTSQRDEATHCWRVTTVAIDITEQHAAMQERQRFETALHESDRRLETVLSSSPYAIFLKNLQGQYTYANPAYEHMTQRSQEQLLGLTDYDFLPLEVAQQCQISDEAAIAGKQPFVFEEQVPSPQGTHTLLITKFPLCDQHNQPYEIGSIVIDITERKQLELALQTSEAKLNDILDSATAAISSVRVDETGNYQYEYMAAGCKTLFGYTRDELLADKNLWRSRVLPDDLDEVLLVEQVNQELTAVVPYRFYCKDGQLRWFSNHIKVRRDQATQTWLVTIIDIDIHDRKMAEIALEQSETKLTDILNNAGAAITQFRLFANLQQTYEFYSSGSEVVFGYSADELMAEDGLWLSCVHPDDLRTVILPASNHLFAERPVTFEFRFRQKDGSWRWISKTASSKRDEAADCWIVTCVAIDISDRKHLEVELQTSEAKLQDILNNTGAGITRLRLFADHQWEYEFYSNGSEAIWGYSADEFMANQGLWLSRVHPDDQIEILFPAFNYLYNHRTITIEFRFQHKDNSWRWISETGIATHEPDTNCLIMTCVAVDITERKQLELALKVSEVKLNGILNSAFGAINSFRVFVDRDWEYEYWSDGCEVFYGYTAQELTADKTLWMSCIHPDDVETVVLPGYEAIFAERPFTIEFRVCHKDGSLRWLSGNYTSRFDEVEQCWRVTGVNVDISDRKQVEVALQQSEARLQTLAKNIPGMIYRYFPGNDGIGAFTYVSSGSYELLELEPDQVLQDANSVWSLIHPEDFLSLQSSVAIAVQNSAQWQWEGRLTTPSGRLKWIQGNSRPQQIFDGVVWDGLLIDITDRKHSEIALRQSQEELQLITDSMPACISYIDAEQRYCFVNKTYEDWFNAAQEALLGKTVREIVGEAAYPLVRPYVEQALAGNMTHYEIELPYPGKKRYVSITLVPKVDDKTSKTQGYYALVTDISDRKHFEQQLKASLREKETLLAEIHHRVKNNLQVISSLLDLQANRTQDPQVQAALKLSQNRIVSMALVHESLYRLEQFTEINFVTYSQELISHLINSYYSPQRQVTLNLDIDAAIAISLSQAVPCSLILNELVTNAMKYGCPAFGKGQLHVSLTMVTDDHIQLAVGNDGDTLPDDFKIVKGVSVGLTLVLLLTDQLKGRLEIERGDRTLFKVIFPRS